MVIFRKISAILMAMFILLTTAGFSLHKHHCTITKETTTSISHVKNCCGTEDEKECPKGCCQDETEIIQLSTDLSLPTTTHEFAPELFVAIIQHFVPNNLFDYGDKTLSKYLNYKPPLILKDIPVLIQSFLI